MAAHHVNQPPWEHIVQCRGSLTIINLYMNKIDIPGKDADPPLCCSNSDLVSRIVPLTQILHLIYVQN